MAEPIIRNLPAGYRTKDQVMAELGIKRSQLDRLCAPKTRLIRLEYLDHQGRGAGSPSILSDIEVEKIRFTQTLPYKDIDKLRFALWKEGHYSYDDLVLWIDERLHNLEKKLAKADFHKIATAVRIALSKTGAGKTDLRNKCLKPLQPILSKIRVPEIRRAGLEWFLARGIGTIPVESIRDRSTLRSKAVRKVIGAAIGVEEAEPSDLMLEFENGIVTLSQMRELASGPVVDREQIRHDYGQLDDIISFADSLDWRLIMGHRRAPDPYAMLIGLWRKLDFRAFVVPSLILMRQRDYALDEWFASTKTVLQAYADAAVEQLDERRETRTGDAIPPNDERPATKA